jgi:hypothetical protein
MTCFRYIAASSFHHTFNLTNTIPSAVLSTFRSSNQLALIAPADEHASHGNGSGSNQYAVFRNLLNQLHDALKERGALSAAPHVADGASQASKKAVRIVLHEFGSLDWSDSVSVTVRSKRLSAFLDLPMECSPAVPHCFFRACIGSCILSECLSGIPQLRS